MWHIEASANLSFKHSVNLLQVVTTVQSRLRGDSVWFNDYCPDRVGSSAVCLRGLAHRAERVSSW